MTAARAAAESAARASYGKLVAILACGGCDIAAAEDALSSAFAAALESWPHRGIPRNPEGWLVTAARNFIHNERRAMRVRAASADEVVRLLEDVTNKGEAFMDERLKLLFVCAHPEIDPAIRAPLMLQMVLGLNAAMIAGAFLTAPATMGQRLVRAKAAIREARLRFVVPEAEELPGRLGEVLDAVYAAYGTGWDVVGADSGLKALSTEALFLAKLIVDLLPEEAEPRGLLALMLYCEARRDARRDPSGAFVPLRKQDAQLWSGDMIVEAERQLGIASQAGHFGRYQCEAAIQSVHVQRPIVGATNYAALRTLYDLLLVHAPSVGVMVSRAAMLLEAGNPSEAAGALEAVPEDRRETYQPYWAVLAKTLHALGDATTSAVAYKRAIGLTEDPAVRAWLDSEARSLHETDCQHGSDP